MSLTVNSMDSNSFNTLFSSLSSSTSNNSMNSGIESLISDYKTLNSGSYGRLLKAYYDKFDSADSSSSSKADNKSEKNSLTETKNDAEDLIGATDKLLSKSADSIWKKIDVENEDGSTTKEYDKDKIYDAVSSFIKNYNSLVDSGQNSSNTGVLTQVASMVTTSSSSSNTLSRVGITIDSKNHLAVDESYFKEKADMATVKSLFNGNSSYGYQVATKASMVKSYSSSNLSELTGSKSYSNSGSYALSTSDLMSSINTQV